MRMRKNIPSIFNDVIGPVMRGPSSSHCAAAVRIGRMTRDLAAGELRSVLVELDPKGSLATTYESQGSAMGLYAGLLGWDTTDTRLPDSRAHLEAAGVTIETTITPLASSHPNTYALTLSTDTEQLKLVAISTGGGAVEIIEVDGARVSMRGDCYEALVITSKAGADRERVRTKLQADEVLQIAVDGGVLWSIKSERALFHNDVLEAFDGLDVRSVRQCEPVMPVLTTARSKAPFRNSSGMLAYNENRSLRLWELAALYEAERGGITQEEVLARMREIVEVIRRAISAGIAGTEYGDRILHGQTEKFNDALKHGRLLDGGVTNTITLYANALMEAKSAMEVIVAAPTAGACAGLPASVVAAAEALGKDDEDIAKALLSAGLIGIFILDQSTFAAEECGCQAECGAGSGMAAAAITELAGGTVEQSLAAASLALQNIFGMVCDPVANRVEVPCLGKNILEGVNAFTCANMALAGLEQVIPLDEVIGAMDAAGRSLPMELRCTGLGGLSLTATSKKIASRLRRER